MVGLEPHGTVVRRTLRYEPQKSPAAVDVCQVTATDAAAPLPMALSAVTVYVCTPGVLPAVTHVDVVLLQFVQLYVSGELEQLAVSVIGVPVNGVELLDVTEQTGAALGSGFQSTVTDAVGPVPLAFCAATEYVTLPGENCSGLHVDAVGDPAGQPVQMYLVGEPEHVAVSVIIELTIGAVALLFSVQLGGAGGCHVTDVDAEGLAPTALVATTE